MGGAEDFCDNTRRIRVVVAFLVFSILVPPVFSGQVLSAQNKLESSNYQAAYKPSYEPSPSYPHPPTCQLSYDPPATNHQSSYDPTAYKSPTYQTSKQPTYEPPKYQPSYTPTYYPKPASHIEFDNYDAITFRELNVSTHCGILPATNDEFYSKNVAPAGKYPWVVQITDEYNNYVCQGVIIHHRYALTARSCIYGSTDKYRVRVNDWDILTNYNEYEPYRNTDFRICNSFPVSYDYASSSYTYGGADSKLLVIEYDAGHNLNDKYPGQRHVCLPTYYHQKKQEQHHNYYSTPIYGTDHKGSSYGDYASHHASYQDSSYSDCWVVGWYGTRSKKLKNHPQPKPAELRAYYRNAHSTTTYNPPTCQRSKIEFQAKVKKVKCYGRRHYEEEEYSNAYEEEEACFVGVGKYDACVADKGAAIVCLVPDKPGYESGYGNNYEQQDQGGNYDNRDVYQASYSHYDERYYKEDIEANPAPLKETRRRAVLYAIVQKTTKCKNCPKKYFYEDEDEDYPVQQKPIKATIIGEKTVDRILKVFWENGVDDSCSPLRSSYVPQYKEKNKSKPKQKKSKKPKNSYFGSRNKLDYRHY